MADSFADLWSTAAPSNSAPQKPRKLNDLISSTTPSQSIRPQNDAFSLLAVSNSSSNSNSRATSPGITNQPRPQSNSPKSSSPSNGDAFSGLLSGSFGNGQTGPGNLSMAEQAAKAEKEKRDRLLKLNQRAATKTQSSAWSGLDSLATTSTFTPPRKQDDIDWVFDTPAPASSRPAPSPPPAGEPAVIADEDDDWGLSDFGSKPTPAPKTFVPQRKAVKPPSIWDLEDVEPPTQPSPPSKKVTRPNSPGEGFDFGSREDRLLGNDSNDEDDILGSLSKPVSGVPPRRPPVSCRRNNSNCLLMDSQVPPRRPVPSARTNSPPPHVIGQIVEMGFGPIEARNALAATDTGLNVEAAVEMLLAERGAPSPITTSPAPPERRRATQRSQSPQDDELRPPVRRRPTNPAVARDSPPTEGAPNIQDQADKLLAQASEIGINVFSKANALWSQGKEKLQKAYEERVIATQTTTVQQSQGARPRWMEEVPEAETDHNHEPSFAATGFRDSDDGEERRPPPRRPAEPKKRPSQEPLPQRPRPQVKTGDLLTEEPIPVYRSPFRHGSSSRTQTPQPTRPPASSKPTPQRTPSPIPVTRRRAIPAPANVIATCMKYKATGTEMFKLGRFGEADTAYTSAIVSLPENHLIQVQLYNNRALSRLKTGEYSGTIEDCSFVISLVRPSYHPQREAKVTTENEGSGVDLADGLMKAYKRRAEAYEGKEKWEDARKDWEAIAGTDWVNGKMRNEAVSGIGRCRKMLNPEPEQVAAKPKIPSVRRPPPKSVNRGPMPPSEALTKLRATTDAAEAEDQARHELKDAVDAKVGAWKGGKEQNIRALVASLENVLWPGLNWQKVGMHELVTPNQVKIRYTKAIAKLHPDKVRKDITFSSLIY